MRKSYILKNEHKKPRAAWRDKVQNIIFETDTPAGKFFDIALLLAILCSFLVILLSTVNEINRIEIYGRWLFGLEWFFTILFTLEYIARMISVDHRFKYFISFFGLIDLLSILPTYLSLFFVGGQYLAILRTFRLLRVFRVLELPQYTQSSRIIMAALQASRPKIIVFLMSVSIIVVVMGGLMYVIENQVEGSGFSSIPRSIYWAIVTITTVGYGDIAPTTVVGQILASLMMIIGYSIIAVPTGIVSVEFSKARKEEQNEVECPQCFEKKHLPEANYCHRCGALIK